MDILVGDNSLVFLQMVQPSQFNRQSVLRMYYALWGKLWTFRPEQSRPMPLAGSQAFFWTPLGDA